MKRNIRLKLGQYWRQVAHLHIPSPPTAYEIPLWESPLNPDWDSIAVLTQHRNGYVRIADGSVEVLMGGGHKALVDEQDVPLLIDFKWRATSHSGGTMYAVTGSHRQMLMHVAIAGRWNDHINGNGLDNRRSNLRPSDPVSNQHNRRKRQRSCSSCFKGVVRRGDIWEASITCRGKRKYIGYYRSEHEAAEAYDESALNLHGEFACLNFPRDGYPCAVR